MLKFQAVAEKTAKNFKGLLFCCTLYSQPTKMAKPLKLSFFCSTEFCHIWLEMARFSSISSLISAKSSYQLPLFGTGSRYPVSGTNCFSVQIEDNVITTTPYLFL